MGEVEEEQEEAAAAREEEIQEVTPLPETTEGAAAAAPSTAIAESGRQEAVREEELAVLEKVETLTTVPPGTGLGS